MNLDVVSRARQSAKSGALVHVARFLGLWLVIIATESVAFTGFLHVEEQLSAPMAWDGVAFLLYVSAVGGWLPAAVLTSAWAGAGRDAPRVMTDGGRKRGGRARRAVRNKREAASRQARGTASNARDLASSFTFDAILPSSIAGFLGELMALVPRALGRGDAKQQVFASITLILIAIISTPFTLGYSLILAAPFGITLLIGLYRLNPALNGAFRRVRGNKLRDRDVPLWKRD